MIRPSRLLLLIALVVTLAPAMATAQRVIGPNTDAVTIPRGVLRTTLAVDNVIHRGRWNDGRAEDLGAGFTIGGLAAPHLSWLSTLDSEFGGIGVSGLNATLGETSLDLRQRLAVTRLGMEFGLTDWLTVSVDAPFVRARAEAQLRARGDSGLATAGLNPLFVGSSVPASNRSTIDAYAGAANSLAARRDDCLSNPAAHTECADILAEGAQVNALIALTQQFATALTNIYGAQGAGGGTTGGLPFVPLAGSPAEQFLRGRVDSLRTAFTRYGVGDISTTGLPLGAQTPLSAEQLAALVSDPVNGYGARPMTRSNRQDLGDVDVGVRFRLFDSFRGDSARFAASRLGIRQTVGLTYRLGGGMPDLPDNFIDLGTGSGHDAVAVRSFTDVIVNQRFWTTVMVGWARGMTHERDLRVPDFAGIEWLEAWRQTTVQIEPGSVIEARISPRFVLNDYFAFGSEWRWRSKAEDRHLLPSTSLLSPSALNTQSAWNEHRFGWTVSYSTLEAKSRGKSKRAIEIGYTHEQSVGSSVGIVPRRWEDRVQIRVYSRLFGR